MYKKIMAAIDDGDTSRRALQEAAAIARAQGAALRILHVADETLLGMHHRTLSTTLNLDHAREAIREAGRSLLAEAATQVEDIDADTLLAEAETRRVSEVIADAAAAWGADLLVVGTHGRRGLERLIVGSVAEQLVRTSPVSLLLVKQHP